MIWNTSERCSSWQKKEGGSRKAKTLSISIKLDYDPTPVAFLKIDLKRKNYDGKSIEPISKKTGDQIYINLTQKARAILEKYITPEHKPDDFIFPVLTGYTGLKDKEILNKAIASKTTVYNKTLRRFAVPMELGINLTTHVARHTWATRAGQLGVRLEIIQAILGHSNIQQTMRYRHIINEELNAAISIIE